MNGIEDDLKNSAVPRGAPPIHLIPRIQLEREMTISTNSVAAKNAMDKASEDLADLLDRTDLTSGQMYEALNASKLRQETAKQLFAFDAKSFDGFSRS
jgi:hypothetical protein